MPSSPLPFVVQHHTMPPGSGVADHFDLMLLHGKALATWACAAPPEQWKDEVQVHRLQDHRMDYLTYAGPVSGERGSVSIQDRGEYIVEAWGKDGVRVLLHGERTRGRVVLTRTGRDDERGEVWMAALERHPPAGLPRVDEGGGSRPT